MIDHASVVVLLAIDLHENLVQLHASLWVLANQLKPFYSDS